MVLEIDVSKVEVEFRREARVEEVVNDTDVLEGAYPVMVT